MSVDEVMHLIKDDPSLDFTEKINKYKGQIESIPGNGTAEEKESDVIRRLFEEYIRENNKQGIVSILNSKASNQNLIKDLIYSLKNDWSNKKNASKGKDDENKITEEIKEMITQIMDQNTKAELFIAIANPSQPIISRNEAIEIMDTNPTFISPYIINDFFGYNGPEDVIAKLILKHKSIEEIKAMIEALLDIYIRAIIAETDNIEFKKYCVEETGLSQPIKTNIIININNPQYTLLCIENREYYDFSESNLVELIISMNDPEYTKRQIEQEGMITRESLIVQLIKSLHDPEYEQDCIENMERLSKESRIYLLVHLKNKDKIEEWIQTEENADIKRILEYLVDNPETYIPKTEDKRKITIPDGLSFGLEIECGGKNSNFLSQCNESQNPESEEKKFGEWTTSIDGSGIEFSSEVLDNSERSTTEIYRMCELLQDIGQSVTEKDGGHLHFGASYFEHQDGEPPFEMENAYLNLIEIFANCEKIFYAISNKPGDAPRGDVDASKPISRCFL